MKEDLLKIINHYGVDKQLKYIHSEYFELDEAIVKYETIKEEDEFGYDRMVFLKEDIAQEIADCFVMLKQFQYYYDIEDSEIEKIMLEKIQRQLGRMESDKECI